ncbi:Integrase catalytic subunit [Pseudomonas savastanoi pv. glycinea]|uniref:Integrase catalytic subunit n=9 Tax=Pseudomonas syringae group TaxID=136849 RepID=A0ABR5L2J0_PSESG|nr:Integrase catalytic subunit [Pseudomonas savastanoi pv. glycinea]KPC37690.1 Integrase catalytic subunit [Pseudomonas savastanoi pv. glycinea]KPC45844.1 Integrase catalytic subunit [Pseudomonas savastanoi pv. glycinea]RMQ18544.1 Integrase catalytic subunit [Pseudomonas savastanoi pv. glycinea]
MITDFKIPQFAAAGCPVPSFSHRCCYLERFKTHPDSCAAITLIVARHKCITCDRASVTYICSFESNTIYVLCIASRVFASPLLFVWGWCRIYKKGCYLASEATFYRVLRAAGQQQHRGRSQRPRRYAAPTTHAAKAPNQVWSWDITYLPSPIRGKYYYLYLIEDIYSRKAVGWEVYEMESGEKAAALLQRSVIGEQCLHEPLVLHSDNGAPMKSVTLLSKMYELGITPSRGRPRVSNHNPYSESLFRTLKYCPQWPQDGFASLDAARLWVRDFMRWYNNDHRHSRIRFVTPAERHRGLDHQILAKRHELYELAREKRPERWSRETRNWEPIGTVLLNPDREQDVEKKAA